MNIVTLIISIIALILSVVNAISIFVIRKNFYGKKLSPEENNAIVSAINENRKFRVDYL